ncbi:MAG: hypothetical protein ACRCUL_00270 [Plesiomonas sp.]
MINNATGILNNVMLAAQCVLLVDLLLRFTTPKGGVAKIVGYTAAAIMIGMAVFVLITATTVGTQFDDSMRAFTNVIITIAILHHRFFVIQEK